MVDIEERWLMKERKKERGRDRAIKGERAQLCAAVFRWQ